MLEVTSGPGYSPSGSITPLKGQVPHLRVTVNITIYRDLQPQNTIHMSR